MTTTRQQQQSADAGLPPAYNPADHENRIRSLWDASGVFHADPNHVLVDGKPPYSILIPPPNVTGALHLGHALNNTLQDILVRMHRMQGFESLWMPGTDHAGIATQTVVDKRLQAEGEPSLKDYKKREAAGEPAREAFIEKVQLWKDEYEDRITNQLKLMGCSCDWERQRFTMDEFCARAVREAFFLLFKAGLIYRGKRLVNWDPVTQTALADDEVEMKEVEGKFYYLRYPLCDEKGAPMTAALPDGEADHVTVATTRPETYLGDTAVAVNPTDPRAKALKGKFVKLPLVGRVIPIVEDDYVVLPDPEGDDPKAKYATGFLKVTPAHDENDYQLGLRHDLPVINVMAPDASISDQDGWSDVGDAGMFLGMSREEARKTVVAEFESRGLLAEIRAPYFHSVGHSYRSHAAIEPYLSDQWYVKVTDDRLAGSAQRAVVKEQQSKQRPQEPGASGQASDSDFTMTFHPSRYAKTFEAWHENIRDWCISRQLWWGHRISVWSRSTPLLETVSQDAFESIVAQLMNWVQDGRLSIQYRGEVVELMQFERDDDELAAGFFCVRDPDGEDQHIAAFLEEHGWRRDPDVLDTWFSSALWPLSTMGWPDPAQAPQFNGMLDAFKPTSVICTARDIITLWVSRMTMFNRFFADGQIPFRDVYIHPVIQDGDGKRMSKSAGNGVDPLDIIHTHGADAMRFTLCQLASQTQDVRMPVERDEATGKNTSPKFDLGKRFCNKLWNASRFTLMMLHESEAAGDPTHRPSADELTFIDRWMLSRIAFAERRIAAAIETYEFNVYADVMYDLLWNEFCDWYLEAVKPTVKQSPAQQSVLRGALDCILRLLHPIAPFVTESIFEALRASPQRGWPQGVEIREDDALLCASAWPHIDESCRNSDVESEFAELQELIRTIRDVRSQQNTPPKKRIVMHTNDATMQRIQDAQGIVETLAGLESVTTDAPDGPSTAFTFAATEHRLSGMADAADSGAERERLSRALAELDGSIAALEKRLSNPGYVDKAPAKLVQETRDQLAAKQAERDATEAALKELG